MRPACLSLLLTSAMIGCSGPDGRFLPVEEGAFRASFTETGELQAARYALVVMPTSRHDYGQPKIEQLEKEGTLVQSGDVVGKIETLGVERALGQKEVDMGMAEGELTKLKVQQQSDRERLQGELRQARSALRMAQMDTQRVAFESTNRRRVERLKYRKAEHALQKVLNKIGTTEKVQVEDLLIQQAKIQQIHSDIAKAKRAIERFVLRAPGDGIVEYRKYRRQRKVAVGDELWSGAPIVGLPDLTEMKVLTAIDETDVGKVGTGLPVSVRLDAYPQQSFDGTVTSISRISRRKDGKSLSKVFDVEVLLATTDPILRPGMTVSCQFLFASIDQATWIHPSCLHVEEGRHVVHVKETFGVRTVPIEIGPGRLDAVVVDGDLQAGDRVLVDESAG